MKFTIKKHIPPYEGQTRYKRGFLFFPKKIGDEMRWLENAGWKEEYQKFQHHFQDIDHGGWQTFYKWVPVKWSYGDFG